MRGLRLARLVERAPENDLPEWAAWLIRVFHVPSTADPLHGESEGRAGRETPPTFVRGPVEADGRLRVGVALTTVTRFEGVQARLTGADRPAGRRMPGSRASGFTAGPNPN